MSDVGDVRLQLNDLEAEEARIMRELRELDEKAQAESDANKKRAEQYKEDPQAAMTSLLLECEKEVRDAKGYIADQGPPLRIVRLRHGETGPKSATYLSRPRNTGVDFTVPVTLKAYTDLIKRPIFLNQIRDKIKQHKYPSSKEYLEDMRLLVRNTAQFNKGPDLAWVVQHARFLLEAAEDAVASRRLQFREIEETLSQRNVQKTKRQNAPSLSAVGKRKRSHTQDKSNGEISAIPAVGSAIEIYWPSYRKWYLAYITAHGDGGTCHLRYDEDNSLQWVTLDHERWRMRNSRFTGAARGKRTSEQPAKRRKAGAPASHTTDQPVYVSGGITPEDLDAIKIDLFAKFDDLRDSMMEQLKDHLGRIDRAIIRSDALSRILLQIEDTQANVEGAVRNAMERFDSLEKRLSESLPRVATQEKIPTYSKPPRNEDMTKEERQHNKSHADRLDGGDPVKQSHLDLDVARAEGKSASDGQTERDKNSENFPEKEVDMVDVDSDAERQVKVSNSSVTERAIDDEEPSRTKTGNFNPSHEHSVGKSETKGILERGSAVEVESGSDKEAEPSKDDTEKAQVLEEDKLRKTDADLPQTIDDTNAPAKEDEKSTVAASRRNRLIKDDLVDLEKADEAEAEAEAEADDRMEESSDSNRPSDSESSSANEGTAVAGKQPATKPELEDKSQTISKSPVHEDQINVPQEVSHGDKSVGAEMGRSGNGIDTEERKKVVADDSTEKPSEEIETVATSEAGNEALEEERHTPHSREQKEVDDGMGD